VTPTPLAAGFAVPALAIAGLAAAAIPVLVHLLLRRRRRPIEWAAMDLLRKALERRRRQLRLERLLLLAIRMAALALLGAALARPYFGEAGRGGESRTIWIVLDDGISTRVAVDADGTAFDRLVEETVAWLERGSVGDEIGVVLAAGTPRVLVEPTADRRRVAERLRSHAPTLAGTDLDAGLALVASRLAEIPSIEPIVLVASEFRRGSLGRSTDESGSGSSGLAAIEDLQRLALPPAETPIDNVQVVSIRPGRAPAGGGPASVAVELARQGSLGSASTRISLSGPRLATAVERDVRWREGDRTASVELLVPVPQLAEGEDPNLLLEISVPPDDQAADDRRFGLLDARRRIRVGIVSDGRDSREWLTRALAPSAETPIELVPIEAALVDETSLRSLDVVVVARPDLVPASGWSDLGAMIDRGGMVMAAPPADGGGLAWLDRLAEIVPDRTWSFGAGVLEIADGPGSRIDPSTPHRAWLDMIAAEFEELAVPVSMARRLDVGSGIAESEIVMRSLDGAPLVLASTAPGGGSLALFAFALDLEWSDLPVRPLMVPLVQELLREGLVRSRIRNVGTVGDEESAGLAAAAAVEAPDGRRLSVREGRLERAIEETGRHEILDAAGGRLGALVANIEASSSATDPSDRGAIASRLEEAGVWSFTDDLDRDGVAAAGESGDARLSMWMIAGVIGLLLVETVLSRRFSRVTGGGETEVAAPAFLAAYGVDEGGRRASETSS